jgi:Ser-tRNA(Ala) deacylase AlaX
MSTSGTRTEKLYWSEPFGTSFETTGAALGEWDGKPALVLKKTLFYPEGGGQLGDSGTIAIGSSLLRIADTRITDDGTIRHVLAEPLPDTVKALLGPEIIARGAIDASRRRDHMVQHTAQHALSRALADEARAETVSARLGATTCTIDVGRSNIPDIELHRAEDLVNALADARAKHAALAALAADLTCGVVDVQQAVSKLRAELKGTRAQLDTARTELADLLARQMRSALPDLQQPIVLPVMRPNDDVGSLRVLAGKLAEDPRVVALCGASDPTSGELVLVIQRGKEGKLDCGAFVLEQAKARCGRGGGRPERAEGRFARGTSLEVLAAAATAAIS